jgi:hypothetical protein
MSATPPAASSTRLPSCDESARHARSSAPRRDGRRDFDFIIGRWQVHNRRLERPLSGCTAWYEFEGRTIEHALWDGQANLEEYNAVGPTGAIRGLALRVYDPAAAQWTIHWSNSATGTLDRPMTGEFDGARGVFYGQDVYEGRLVLLRFLWTSTDSASARWEQAFSADGGTHWETNWIMEFTRMADDFEDEVRIGD